MNNISFNGKIKFVNKASYKNFIVHRKEINQLKYHCGNNNFTHFIQYDKDFFIITTEFEHERKIDGTTAHVLSEVHSLKNKDTITKIITDHIAKTKDWKSGIEQIQNYSPATTQTLKNENLVEKIIRFFKKR